MRIGIISDTHGVLRPEAERALQGTDLIVHAGDVGDAGILTTLKRIAPVFAVRGNVDIEPWAMELPSFVVVEAGTARLFVLHNLKELDLVPAAAGFHVVVSGHTHKAEHFERDGVLYVNPGSAGPQRFRLPVTLAVLDVSRKPWKPEILELPVGQDAAAKRKLAHQKPSGRPLIINNMCILF